MQAGTAVGNLASAIGIRPDETDLVAQLKAGSEEAFAWLVATYHQPVYSLIARTLPVSSDAADITQEVFVKIYRGISGFHGDASLRTWIYRIALHEASNQRRWWSRHRRQEVTIEAETGESNEGQPLCIKDTLVDEHDSPFEMAAQAEIHSRVEAELREVPDPFRTVVILRDIEGLAYEEIAEILNVNLGTVKSRLMRGRAHLKARLAPFAEAARKRPSQTSLPLQPSLATEEAQ
ncbi:MAG TPA: sigma-70 family RNA polymerase sigma factor [Silvibacterium sp.]|jgi:RNA polymerase sigma-70 factor (ECF subfamily)|nr:sigma-70 family RNA polymerase sigma factor [Silvibacterium sp.]